MLSEHFWEEAMLKTALVACALMVGVTTLSIRDASSNLYSACMVKSMRWAMDNFWLDVGPGVMIQAAMGACGRYSMRV